MEISTKIEVDSGSFDTICILSTGQSTFVQVEISTEIGVDSGSFDSLVANIYFTNTKILAVLCLLTINGYSDKAS